MGFTDLDEYRKIMEERKVAKANMITTKKAKNDEKAAKRVASSKTMIALEENML